MPSFQRAFHQARFQPPYIPFVGDLFIHLFGGSPESLEQPLGNKYYITINRIDMLPFTSLFPSLENKAIMRSCDTLGDITNKKYKETYDIKNAKSFVKLPKQNLIDSATYSTLDLEALSIIEISSINLHNAIYFLKESQYSAQKYELNQNTSAREYLLRARYQEDIDNYLRSISLEKI
ncbi:Protein of unknown function [Gryllus bimaculatus]|nr:Protein of unknown function [Gryllus bimaculatus]